MVSLENPIYDDFRVTCPILTLELELFLLLGVTSSAWVLLRTVPLRQISLLLKKSLAVSLPNLLAAEDIVL